MIHKDGIPNSSRIQDLSDIVLLISSRRGVVSEEEMREVCERFGPDGVMARILAALPHLRPERLVYQQTSMIHNDGIPPSFEEMLRKTDPAKAGK